MISRNNREFSGRASLTPPVRSSSTPLLTCLPTCCFPAERRHRQLRACLSISSSRSPASSSPLMPVKLSRHEGLNRNDSFHMQYLLVPSSEPRVSRTGSVGPPSPGQTHHHSCPAALSREDLSGSLGQVATQRLKTERLFLI